VDAPGRRPTSVALLEVMAGLVSWDVMPKTTEVAAEQKA
jgi:hypothetical protein